jgi:branched-chain amino acid transport system ATP-binding protein
MTTADPPGAPVLEAIGLTKQYGALTVLDDVSVHLAPGEALGIVGTNGAGKTTLLALLAGAASPTAGSIRFQDLDITHQDPATRCRHGIARAHQVPRPFEGMTVFENVLVGAINGGQLDVAAANARSLEVLEICGLLPLANRNAGRLGLLDRKRLELARALATDPVVLLLDETAGGLTDAEAQELVTTIVALRNSGTAIIWIEHVVHVLVQVVERLICMDSGRIISEGLPDDVLNDRVVIDAYLGTGMR